MPPAIAALVSQAISRKLSQLNFYDTILQLDGHEIERLIPPRDLRSWLDLPVSSIANFRVISVDRLELESLSASLAAHPFRCLPVVQEGRVVGVLRRDEGKEALRAGRRPRLEAAILVPPTESIRKIQARLIESSSGMVVLTDGPNERLIGLVTLHDLLRAELVVAERSTE